ncbi:hypothetical protein PHYSODRAFT_295083 [Phytophthora sojae]|uniref:PH domain-containing protein n=1 Tax=Phytophthora sojae (strain P6497) TaxID=1094619 RepID=G4YNE6_PHYSP|nr:hypothetical protein PHYSODRAFT_295083 [Phytophthora sojae]EGZ30239.1 hypothetical protein PHYSODRAFT_295083 [Phytophthora sojae]|eukprot:XP_009517514.1 hypothetical protein PHYSODRAFT_295083 [Phytophthora sojae]
MNTSKPFSLVIYSESNRILRVSVGAFTDIKEWDIALARATRKGPCFGNSDEENDAREVTILDRDEASCLQNNNKPSDGKLCLLPEEEVATADDPDHDEDHHCQPTGNRPNF